MDMGKIIGEGYTRDGIYGQQRKAVVILRANGDTVTSYADFE